MTNKGAQKNYEGSSIIQVFQNSEKPNTAKVITDLNNEDKERCRTELKKSSEDSCCYREAHLDFYAKLIWPIFIILLIILFWKYIFKILDLLVELIPKIKQFNAAGVEVLFKEPESYVQEFVKDVAESNEDQQENPSPYNDLNEAYRDSQKFDKKNSIMAVAKMKAEIILFEELAIKQLEQIVKKEITTGKTISLSGKKLSADGYFSFEGTFWLIEVKMLKRVEALSITRFIEMLRDLEAQKSNLSILMSLTIVEVRGVLIIPSGSEIRSSAKSLILSHHLVVYELNKETGSLTNLFDEY